VSEARGGGPELDGSFAAAGAGLAPGDRVAPSTIAGRLGAGGMGTVYRARDGAGRSLALRLRAVHLLEAESPVEEHPGLAEEAGE